MPTSKAAFRQTTPPSASCPKCGFVLAADDADLPNVIADAQRQIDELQSQVSILTAKASSAVDRWADYEDELAKLRAELQAQSRQQQDHQQQQSSTLPHKKTSSASSIGFRPLSDSPKTYPSRTTFLSAGGSKISSLLSRKSSPNLKGAAAQQSLSRQSTQPPLPPNPVFSLGSLPGSSSPLPQSTLSTKQTGVLLCPAAPLMSPTSPADELFMALTCEQALRQAAEGRLSQTSREVEELSVTLFEQANEMVASERRARARLEERVEILERRDAEKKRRLDRIESAMERIERVRRLLEGETEKGGREEVRR